ncbi:MAG TPA: type II toxin-antitoxin system HicB family antitoxin [Stellaceae bacterium]|jgi:antitoxin HicB|nr:type II toxin-antitoxin system HicB family antitoxin [Stellaceae bacterium]
MMYAYPVTLAPDDNGTILVAFPDIPFAHTFGKDEDDALARAVDALESAFVTIIADREDVPVPSKARRGQKVVALPAVSAVKVALYEAMRASGIRKADLARRLGWHMPQVDRLLDLRHASRMDQIEAALDVLGKRLVMDVKPKAA